MATVIHICPVCGTGQRVTEPNAFGGRDTLRSSLSCGHVVLKDNLITEDDMRAIEMGLLTEEDM